MIYNIEYILLLICLVLFLYEISSRVYKCWKKSNLNLKKFSTEELLRELYFRGKEIESDLTLINPTLSKYGINLRAAPIHHTPPWEKVILTKCTPCI